MSVADRPQSLEVADGWDEHPGRPRHRFHDHRGYRVATMLGGDRLEHVGQISALGRLSLAEEVGSEAVGCRQVADVRQQVIEVGVAIRRDTADRDPAESHAVVAAKPTHESRALVIAARLVIGDRDLERRIHRLGAGIGEEDVIQIARRQFGQLRRELKRERVPHVEARGVVERRRPPGDRFDDALPAVSSIHTPESGRAVEHRVPINVLVVHPLGRDEETRGLLEGLVGGERHPELVQRQVGLRSVGGELGGGHGADDEKTKWRAGACR